MKKLTQLSEKLFDKSISKSKQAIINGGSFTLTNCRDTGTMSDCTDQKEEGLQPIQSL